MNLDERVSNYLDAFETAVAQYGPQAADFALFYVRVNSLAGVAAGIILFAIAFVLFRVAMWINRTGPTDSINMLEPPHMFAMIGAAVGGAIATVGGVINALEPWNWIGIFAPQLKLVHDAIKIIGN